MFRTKCWRPLVYHPSLDAFLNAERKLAMTHLLVAFPPALGFAMLLNAWESLQLQTFSAAKVAHFVLVFAFRTPADIHWNCMVLEAKYDDVSHGAE